MSTIPATSTNVTLLHALRTHGYTKQLGMAAYTVREAELLKQAGVDVVLIPFADAAERAVELLSNSHVLALKSNKNM